MLIRIYSLITFFLLTSQIDAKSGRRKGELKESFEDDWPGIWFPFNPNIPFPTTTKTPPINLDTELNSLSEWKLRWFPFEPNSRIAKPEQFCDDGERKIEVDFDMNNKQYSYNYLCMTSNRQKFEPNVKLEAIEEVHIIPPAFIPPIKCMNETIVYDSPLATFGAFRPVAPKFGKYQFLPQQRWLRSIAEGAILMLYHPCAFPGQVKLLQDTLTSCLYRHIITPSQHLSPERPLALLAWGKILSMSVVDERMVVDFIKSNAKHGPIPMKSTSTKAYTTGLIKEAKLITDTEDVEICGYKEM